MWHSQSHSDIIDPNRIMRDAENRKIHIYFWGIHTALDNVGLWEEERDTASH
jgi:hypothetical protein